ncbi:MAG TPA: PilT/PilU family type 4a pilus ATPase [Candidatus Dormibacteraeota bacterium]|nr:PilT/PilU family type 4a pilus ATPase [Candidatus Dormibacteraeota bacterium]
MTSALATILLSDTLHAAQMRGASDVHFAPGLPPVLRIDGRLEACGASGVSPEDVERVAASLFGDAERERLAEVGDATTTIAEEGTTIRAHAARTMDGLSLTLRFLAREVPSPRSLELPEVLSDLARAPRGLLMLGGPTGSGKSTTLASLIAMLNDTSARKIITLEDPVEYRIPPKRSLIVQRQIGRDVRTFAEAIRGALRSDPDVIVIGEMRDADTISAAIAAAETGHLVLATVHTGDVPQSVDRLIDAFPSDRAEHARGRIANVLLAVICQRLVPRATGSGRHLAAEVLVATDAVRHMIRDGKHHQLPSVMATSRRFGMQTLEAHLSSLVARGAITPACAEAAR